MIFYRWTRYIALFMDSTSVTEVNSNFADENEFTNVPNSNIHLIQHEERETVTKVFDQA